eukprot:2752904-Alexandrium_andersonii.AAC.1
MVQCVRMDTGAGRCAPPPGGRFRGSAPHWYGWWVHGSFQRVVRPLKWKTGRAATKKGVVE